MKALKLRHTEYAPKKGKKERKSGRADVCATQVTIVGRERHDRWTRQIKITFLLFENKKRKKSPVNWIEF